MAKKIYAVKKGSTTGIFTNWEACKVSVEGYPGAEYKGFSTREEAEQYLEAKNEAIEKTDIVSEHQVIAYVDGSYDEKLGRYAFGCVLILPGGEIIKDFGNGENPESLVLHNVAGEMLGAMYAVQWCLKNEYPAIKICYDYAGIEAWVTGAWKAKNALTKKYAEFMKESTAQISITFEKVAAHSGNHFNEEADKLAKKALTEGNGIPKIKKGDYWFTIEDISWDDMESILELVQEEIEAEQVLFSREEKTIAHGKTITIKTGNKDKVVVNHYTKGNKIVMQGKPNRLFSAVLAYVTELVEVEEIPKIYNNAYRINIDKDEVCTEFKFHMPNAYDKLPQKLSRTLHQAVYNLKLTGDMFDGTFLAQPVIRGIEAHLKMLMINLQIVPDWKYVKEHGFDMFNKSGAKFNLVPERYGIATPEEVKYVGNCYTFYNANRNQLSHWDDPVAGIDTTKLLDVTMAHDLIKRTLALIDEYYVVI